MTPDADGADTSAALASRAEKRALSRASMRRAILVIRVVISVALLVLIARRVEWSALGTHMRTVDAPRALGASLLTFSFPFLLALRWRIFIRRARIRIPFLETVRLTWVGMFFNTILPGSIGGDAVKLVEFRRYAPGRTTDAAAAIVLDRAIAVVALAAVAAPAFVVDLAPMSALATAQLPIGKLAVVAGGLAVVCVTALAFVIRKSSVAVVRRAVAAFVSRLLSGATRGDVALGLVVSVAIVFVSVTAAYGFATALGIDLSFAQSARMLPVILVLLMLPITVNGHGVREALLTLYFTAYGIVSVGDHDVGAASAALALSMLIVASEICLSIPGGLLYLLRPRLASERTRNVPE